MLPTGDLFVHIYVLADDAIAGKAVAIPPRPGPVPACSDAEVLTVALVRHLLGRRSEAGWLAEVRRDWAHLFPRLPVQSEFNRRARWLWGAFEALRAHLAARLPEDSWQQIDTTALPVRHPWFYGFRLAVRADLGSRLVRGWGIVPAAVNEREAADDLLDGTRPPAGLLLERGFAGRDFAARHAGRGTAVVLAHSRAQRHQLSKAQRRPVAALCNRIETSIGEITEDLGLAHHKARTFWGLLTRTAATLAAHTLLRLQLI
jgi:Transposase DDE domain